MSKNQILGVLTVLLVIGTFSLKAQQPSIIPSQEELQRSFGEWDIKNFQTPEKVFYPETWFHYIGGNVSLEGITADLEAIKSAGISGVQLFHGQFGGVWPGVNPSIPCLSPLWDNAVEYTAKECKRLGLRFTMQNCAGWAMSGGPWIKPENAMRNLVWSRTDVDDQKIKSVELSKPQPSDEDWRDYQDIAVLAFPTPLDDSAASLQPANVEGNGDFNWIDCFSGNLKESLKLSATTTDKPYQIDVSFAKTTIIRSVVLPSIQGMNHAWCFEPGITFMMEAISNDGKVHKVIDMNLPSSNWQDNATMTIACAEIKDVDKYRFKICNKHDISLNAINLLSGARKNNWESEAAWTLRNAERTAETPIQSNKSYIDRTQILDLSSYMNSNGHLSYTFPKGEKWTVLRIGNVNAGRKNAPAPPEGTGWECDKLSEKGPEVHFAGYIGRLAEGPLKGGLLNGMLMDSWECNTQTWTKEMPKEFLNQNGYPLQKWLPAVIGFVIDDQETTAQFLLDWKRNIGRLYSDKFYGKMAELAKKQGLNVQYETAAGDVFPADIMEYFKYADVPMCEFWQPMSEGFVGSLNFKPIKPTVSAARLYGKPRVAAEAFTSFSLTWDEHLEMLKEVANVNCIEGVTHLVFHTYTHNPKPDSLIPGSSLGSNIGTPFLRSQTWWKYMPEFTTYLARCNYMLERGMPVSDILWYLGDEISHKPDQEVAFPSGYKYDYCNPDILLNRLNVKDGLLSTPEGVTYRLLWIPENERMLPETLEKIHSLLEAGAIIVANSPKNIATMQNKTNGENRFNKMKNLLWPQGNKAGEYKVGKGTLISGMNLEEAINTFNMTPDVKGDSALWLHRKIDGADVYYVCAPKDKAFNGTLDFNTKGNVEMWNPLTGERTSILSKETNGYTSVDLDLPHAGSCFVVFNHNKELKSIILSSTTKPTRFMNLDSEWTVSFPSKLNDKATSFKTNHLEAWKDMNLSEEGKSFSGTAKYTTSFILPKGKERRIILDLGKVEMIASVTLNGKELQPLWTSPYEVDITDAVKKGENNLTVEVTSSWYNRLVYDAKQPESQRKTWTINGPQKDAPLRDSGLLGPVKIWY